MLAFILRRVLQSIAVLVAVGLIAFAMFRFAGDPVNQIVSIDTSYEQRMQIRASLGLDDPFIVQFTRYAARALRGDLRPPCSPSWPAC
jgi:peptide/nickel transport system permease protein